MAVNIVRDLYDYFGQSVALGNYAMYLFELLGHTCQTLLLGEW